MSVKYVVFDYIRFTVKDLDLHIFLEYFKLIIIESNSNISIKSSTITPIRLSKFLIELYIALRKMVYHS